MSTLPNLIHLTPLISPVIFAKALERQEVFWRALARFLNLTLNLSRLTFRTFSYCLQDIP